MPLRDLLTRLRNALRQRLRRRPRRHAGPFIPQGPSYLSHDGANPLADHPLRMNPPMEFATPPSGYIFNRPTLGLPVLGAPVLSAPALGAPLFGDEMSIAALFNETVELYTSRFELPQEEGAIWQGASMVSQGRTPQVHLAAFSYSQNLEGAAATPLANAAAPLTALFLSQQAPAVSQPAPAIPQLYSAVFPEEGIAVPYPPPTTTADAAAAAAVSISRPTTPITADAPLAPPNSPVTPPPTVPFLLISQRAPHPERTWREVRYSVMLSAPDAYGNIRFSGVREELDWERVSDDEHGNDGDDESDDEGGWEEQRAAGVARRDIRTRRPEDGSEGVHWWEAL